MIKLQQQPKSDFHVLNYRYDEPPILPDENNSLYDFTYNYQFISPYTEFLVVADIFLIIKNSKENICYSEISTLTAFDAPKETWIKIGLLIDSGELTKDIDLLVNPVTDLVERAISLAQNGITARQINTKCDGIDLFKIDREKLFSDIQKRILQSHSF